MQRVPNQDYAVEIRTALRAIPERFHSYLHNPHFLCGVDPVFAGLHTYHSADDGRSYRNTAHCAYPFHQVGPADRRHTTVVLPNPAPWWVIVHELGHVLHYALGFDHQAEPITVYARSNHYEAFAEAFTSYLIHGGNYMTRPDAATVALLDAL